MGEAVHQLGRIAMLAAILVLVSVLLLGFRLSQGPILLPELASRLATAASGHGISVEMKEAELTWAGYRQGGGVPVYLRLGDIAVRNGVGVTLVSIPSAKLELLPSALMGTAAPLLVSAAHAQFSGSSVPVSLQAAIWPGADFNFARAEVGVTLGPGRLGVGVNSLPVDSGGFSVKIAPGAADLAGGFLDLSRTGASKPRMTFSGNARLSSLWNISISATADEVQAGDMAAYWPPGLIPMTRRWVLNNITAGTARNAGFVFSLTAPPDLGGLRLANATGSFSAEDLTLRWLDGATPLIGLNGGMVFQDLNNALVTAETARLGGLVLTHGQMALSDMSVPAPTMGQVDVSLAGTVPDAIAVLNAPPLSLLSQAPPQLAKATGNVTAAVEARIPFVNDLQLENTGLRVTADLSQTAFGSGVQGLPFSQGKGVLEATVLGLTAKADLQFAGQPAQLNVKVGFSGKGGTEDVSLKSLAGPVLLRRLGLDTSSGVAGGAVPYSLHITGNATGTQNLALQADLTPAALRAAHLGWSKPAGAAGELALSATLRNGQFASLDGINASAPGLNIQGQTRDGEMAFSTINIGRTVASGVLRPPAAADAAWVASFSGPMLDLRTQDTTQAKTGAAASTATDTGPPSGALWRAQLNFEQLALAASPAPVLNGFSFSGNGQGGTLLQGSGMAGDAALSITPASPLQRHALIQAPDAGLLLRAMNAYEGLQGGALTLDADYGGGLPATGQAVLTDFRLLKAPAFTKIMQALTVYGVPAAASGPGLSFARAVVPFSLDGAVLNLQGARAYSASLGFTATGRIGLDDGSLDVDTTIIPAYEINALPGKIPLLGHLFTAEKGGGLIAARVKITGTMDDPNVGVNPLSALTPGFLRGIFGIGSETGTK
ncbi:hypothetical protein GCM10010909_09000 [Acidocella aquatica]|uniref:YhdP central domain-containing protein n=1 Tax=Acidocella aquatica TaxID=1922313 RepID=A0ABQ6A190_9PROT|nr:hypothetical protein GCM10010909_09000 [Acidocella aquatica]